MLQRLKQIARQLDGESPFEGELKPSRVPVVAQGAGRPSLPFPHPWNYREPLRILDAVFWEADRISGPGRHTRYLDVPGFTPVLITRDPRLIRKISSETGDKPGQFDRDTMPTDGIARATGGDTLLYANGVEWKNQKRIVTPPFARTTLFQPQKFREFEATFRKTAHDRLAKLALLAGDRGFPVRAALEPEVKAVMLEMLVNNFFGASMEYDEIRGKYVPALDAVIDHIVADTVLRRVGVRTERLPFLRKHAGEITRAKAAFEELTDIALSGRADGTGQWGHFKSDAADDALRGNIRVFLAGALEATTSYACWALAHLARRPDIQRRIYDEVCDIDEYTPEALAGAPWLNYTLSETLRLTPSLYFHPRRATDDTWVEVDEGLRLRIPKGTHILLDVWHSNRHEDHWGIARTGFRADAFEPARWERLAADGKSSNDALHFGFGHGPRFCPGKSLGQLEVALVVGAVVKLFTFSATHDQTRARAGVSTKPDDGTIVDLTPRPNDLAPRRERSAMSNGCPFGYGGP